eukprot:TRINITY_DN5646_c1_g1_i1.p1 TRINITY_DN5646_c1_g1~~TRINITY_DN5646_c1_g1_i1.p1  ORF type:complete len:237 (-),score=80.30 TRINITY_DN5646_c1_g1_i1:97-807(-)
MASASAAIASSSATSITAQEEDAIIRQRLLTRVTVTRGEPPLKKLIRRFLAFAGEVERETGSGSSLADCERAYKAFLQELANFEVPLLKTRAVVDSNLREIRNFEGQQEQLDRAILRAQEEIQELKAELEEARKERKHNEECEAIRRLIAAQPPREETESAIAVLQQELTGLERENLAAIRTLDLRKKQFSLLMHVVDELEMSIDAESLPQTARDNETHEGKAQSESQPMDVDEKR